MRSKLVAALKAATPMEVTLSGIDTLVSLEQPLKV